MIRFSNDIVGVEVVLFQEHATLGPVKSLIFSPYKGDVLGLMVFDPIKKEEAVIRVENVRRMVGGVIIADGYDALTDPKDLIRINEAIKENTLILKEKVITEDGQYLGRVTAVAVETTTWKLVRIYVNPPLGLNYFAKELIIPAKKIIRIEKKEIIVASGFAKVKGLKKVLAPSPVLE